MGPRHCAIFTGRRAVCPREGRPVQESQAQEVSEGRFAQEGQERSMEKKKFTAITVIFAIISAAFLLIIAAMLVPYLRSVLGLEVYIEKLLGKGTY